MVDENEVVTLSPYLSPKFLVWRIVRIIVSKGHGKFLIVLISTGPRDAQADRLLTSS